ncbi:MAG: hypothetical protein ACJ796_05110 [Gemmatimonadaceae bacterium]
MRAHSVALAAALIVVTPPQSLIAQAPKLDGAWKSVGGRVVAPDTSYDIPAFTGLAVIHGRYISQTFVTQPPNGVQQAGELKDVETKAARYDAVVASAGTIDVHGKTFVMHFQQAQAPALVGQSTSREYSLHGDTLFSTESFPWQKDKTKLVRETLIFLRLPPEPASRLNGVWRHLTTEFSSPDTSYRRSAAKGLLVIHGKYYSRTFALDQKSDNGQGRNPVDARAKAARYDSMIANAGVLTLDGETLTQHVEEATDLAAVGSSTRLQYRLHGDTLFTTATEPWQKDSAKVARMSVSFVRVR